MSAPPRVVVFDVIETLFSLAPTRTVMSNAGLASASLELWFARLLRDAFAITAAGGYAEFEAVGRGALMTMLDGGEDQEPTIARIFDSLRALPAHPDAAPALERCVAADVAVVALTNGTAATAEQLLERSGLAPLITRVLSVHDVGVWKPAARVYRAAIGDAVTNSEAALVAVHGWDIYGARRAGLMTGSCSRLEGVLSPALGPADVEGDDLLGVVEELLGS